MDQAVALPIGCPSYNQALGHVDVWAALEERVECADVERHPVAL